MPGKFVCQTSVLLEVTKTCETARMLQPKHERGEGLGKEKRLFPVVLLFCFRIRVDSFFFRHRNETEIKLVDLPRLPSIFFTWRFWGEFPKFSYSKWFSLGCREGSLHFPKGQAVPGGGSPAPFALVEFLSMLFGTPGIDISTPRHPMRGSHQLRRSVWKFGRNGLFWGARWLWMLMAHQTLQLCSCSMGNKLGPAEQRHPPALTKPGFAHQPPPLPRSSSQISGCG